MSDSGRFSIDHVGAAIAESTAVERAQPSPDLLRESSTGGPRKPARVAAGRTYGDLTTVRVVGRAPSSRARLWLCRCACGGSAIRSSGSLNAAVRAGRVPACRTCRRELARGLWAARVDALREAYRKQYVDYRTLWTAPQTAALMTSVRRALAEEFGEPEETPPRLPLSMEAGYPWSYGDRGIAQAGWARWHGRPLDVDEYSNPYLDDDPEPLTDDELSALRSLEES